MQQNPEKQAESNHRREGQTDETHGESEAGGDEG